MVNFLTIKINEEVNKLIEDAKKEYLKHHPEMELIPLSKSKILYEALKYYIQH